MVSPLVLYRTEIRHRRQHPVPHRFSYRSYWWLVDVDQIDTLPRRLRLLYGFRARDYSGAPNCTIADNVRGYLAGSDISPTGLTIQMLTTPRQLGYSFNPITVFYCSRDGSLVAVVAEVHNTYGGRHRYLLAPDDRGRSYAPKRLPVSPFFDTAGCYRIDSPAPDATLRLAVQLDRDGEPPFIASVVGQQVPITARTVASALLLGTALLTTARIRRQGISLWRKRLHIHPRESERTLHA